MEKLVPRPIFM